MNNNNVLLVLEVSYLCSGLTRHYMTNNMYLACIRTVRFLTSNVYSPFRVLHTVFKKGLNNYAVFVNTNLRF